VYQIPYPYWHQLGLPVTATEEVVKQSLYQLDMLLKQQSGPQDTAAIIVEPVLGEGGYVPAPSAFLRGLRDICDQHGILLIVDEVQCGFGRTGKNFYIENSGVKPDIMLVAKVRATCHANIIEIHVYHRRVSPMDSH
jgi:4-aminobutyrate aminotransferase